MPQPRARLLIPAVTATPVLEAVPLQGDDGELKPFWTTTDGEFARLYLGDVIGVLKRLPERSVQCVTTSPPYWSLRDYGTGTWEGGDTSCEHSTPAEPKYDLGSDGKLGRNNTNWDNRHGDKRVCKCGAVRTDHQLGSESRPDCAGWARGENCAELDWQTGCHVCRMVLVFREVRRVLRDDGVCWINYGDSYSSGGKVSLDRRDDWDAKVGTDSSYARRRTMNSGTINGAAAGLPSGNLVGVPWRFALAMQADGWVLRSDIPWVKRSAMPESCRNRPAKALEYVFMFSKAKWIGPELKSGLSEFNKSWLALLFDTEGNICVKRHRRPDGRTSYGIQIGVGCTSQDLLNRAKKIVGKGSLNERAGTNAPMFQWQLANREARDLLVEIYPYLIIKQRQARLAVYLQSLLRHRGTQLSRERTHEESDVLDRIWTDNKDCNHFGDPDLSWVPNWSDLVTSEKIGRWVVQPYFYDGDAIRKKATNRPPGNVQPGNGAREFHDNDDQTHRTKAALWSYGAVTERNFRNADLWFESVDPPHGMTGIGDEIVGMDVTSQGYAGAHFATYPGSLITPFILAGTSEYGACADCGAPWRRVTERTGVAGDDNEVIKTSKSMGDPGGRGDARVRRLSGATYQLTSKATNSWQPTCECHGKIVKRQVVVSRAKGEVPTGWAVGTDDHTAAAHNTEEGRAKAAAVHAPPGLAGPKGAGRIATGVHQGGVGSSTLGMVKGGLTGVVRGTDRTAVEHGGKKGTPGGQGNQSDQREFKEEIEETIEEYVSDLPLDDHPVVPCVVLDPFIGSGTSVVVANAHGRRGWGIDLSEKYLRDNAIPRIEGGLLNRPATVGMVPGRGEGKAVELGGKKGSRGMGKSV